MFNALKYTKKLEDVGLTREQAEAHVFIMTEIIETNLATKEDLKDLRAEMKDLKTELRTEMKELRTDFENRMIQMEYRLVIKLGTMATITIATMATVMKFF